MGAGAASAGGGGDVTAPTLVSATIPTAGTHIDLVYDESLDTGSTPATGDFAITVPSGVPPTISGISFQTTSVANDTVRVSVATELYEPEGAGVSIDYTADANPIQDTSGNDAANLTSEAVTNNSTVWPLSANGAAFSPEDGTLAGFMTDVTGNGNPLTTDSNDPTIDAVTHGDAVVDFNGTSHRLRLPTATCTALSDGDDLPATVIAGIRPTATGRYLMAISGGANYPIRASIQANIVRSQRLSGATVTSDSGASHAASTWSTFGFFVHGTTASWAVGSSTTLSPTGAAFDTSATTSTTAGWLGSTISGGGPLYVGQLGRLVLDSVDVSATSRDHAVLQTWVHEYTATL